jgi:hypothetical protein
MKSSSRNGATVRVLAVHTTEGAMTVGDLRAFFDRPNAKGSSHASADSSGNLAEGAADGFVPYDRSAWTLRNGNPWSENLELCAHAGWTRSQWLSRPRLLEACALWLARRSKARGIPLVKLTVAQLRLGQRGVIDHDDYSDATGDGLHWDVGENFPWDVVIPRAVALAGGTRTPEPVPITKRRARMYYLTSDESQTVFVQCPDGMRVLYTMEQVHCIGWLVNETRAVDAILHFNRRFHDVLNEIWSLPVLHQQPVKLPPAVQEAVRRTAGRHADASELFEATGYATPDEPWGPPAPVEDPDAIAPPPGFTPGVDPHAPGHA